MFCRFLRSARKVRIKNVFYRSEDRDIGRWADFLPMRLLNPERV